MSTHTNFRIYRYQLLPLDRNETKDLFHNLQPNEIIARKNEFFSESLGALPSIKHRDSEIIIQVSQIFQDLFSLQLAPSRPLTRETTNSQLEKIDNWPHITAYILNSPDDQYFLIQDRVSAFANTDTVANLVKRGTKHTLERFGLSLHIEPLFNKKYFWSLVEEYKNRITCLEFEFITPNMANISQTLAGTLKNLGKDTNAVREELTLSSDAASSLDITQGNETIRGLVEYTSEGGGDITLKIKGIRKKFHTSKSTREVYLSGLELSAKPEQIISILREALK